MLVLQLQDSYIRTVVDSMRESIHTLRCDFLCLEDTQSERTRRGKPVLICILACSLAFHAITLERSSFMKIAFFKIQPV